MNPVQLGAERGFSYKNELRRRIISMNMEEEIMFLKEKQAFWKGVVAGILGSAAFFSGLVALIYYMIQIVQAIK
jgi:hypothetical protein